jgi:hypothetical protein
MEVKANTSASFTHSNLQYMTEGKGVDAKITRTGSSTDVYIHFYKVYVVSAQTLNTTANLY